MANNAPVPLVNAVIAIAIRVPNPATAFNPAANSVYSAPLHGSCEQTYKRTDVLFLIGVIPSKQQIRNIPENPISTTTGNWRSPDGRALTIGEMTFNVDKHLSTVKYRCFRNLRGIVSQIVQQMGGRAVFAAATPAQNIIIFRQFYQQDPYNVTRAMLQGAGAKAINLDAIFNSQHVNQTPIGQNSGFDQVVVLRQWFEYFFEESCTIVGQRYIWGPTPNPFGPHEARLALQALRGQFLAANNNPQNNNPPVHILDPRNMPV